MSRYANRDRLLTLDPVEDHQEIVRTLSLYEFPWLITRSLEFALFRTYAVPSISKLLDETGQFRKYGQRRYDDTTLIMAEITEHGYDSERGRAALRRMNRLHGRFDISNMQPGDRRRVAFSMCFPPLSMNPIAGSCVMAGGN